MKDAKLKIIVVYGLSLLFHCVHNNSMCMLCVDTMSWAKDTEWEIQSCSFAMEECDVITKIRSEVDEAHWDA